MRVLVLVELSADVALREQSVGVRDERHANAEQAADDWHIYRVDPADASAVDLSLHLKADSPGTDVTLLHLGPASSVHWMREELARGCDRAIRIWGDDAAGVGTQAKALILASAVGSCGFDIVLTGCANATSAGGQLGVLLARHLGVPCVTQASGISNVPDQDGVPDKAARRLHITRDLARGYRERIEVGLPAVITVAATEVSDSHTAPLSALLRAQDTEVALWDLSNLGVPREALRRADEPLRLGDLRAPRPRTQFIAGPDSSAPAFDRILQIMAGVVKRREGRVVRGTDDEVAEEVFASLRREGWLDHVQGPDDGA